MPRLLRIAGIVALCATVGALTGVAVAISYAMDTEPLAPFGFDDPACPDHVPAEWSD